MIKIHFSKHLIHRAKLRDIDLNQVKEIVLQPEVVYYDSLNETKIALKKRRLQIWMVAFTQKDNEITIVTTHLIKKAQINNRLKSNRWILLK